MAVFLKSAVNNRAKANFFSSLSVCVAFELLGVLLGRRSTVVRTDEEYSDSFPELLLIQLLFHWCDTPTSCKDF